MRWAICFACCGLICTCTFALQIDEGLSHIKRLYVEAFPPSKNGTEKLREDMIARLRKSRSISLVANKLRADAILSGNGEIWIRGYRSLNPRSGRSPSGGTPVYGGVLSVELKDRKGDTLWSYLVSSQFGSGDIAKDLSKEMVKHLADALGK